MDGWALVVIPLLTALLSGSVVAFFTRRSSKEANATTAFDVVAKSLLATNEALRDDVKQLKADIVELRAAKSTAELDNHNLRTRVATLEDELEEVKEGNRSLADSLGKLIEAWPPTHPMPPLDPKWQQFRSH